MKLPHYSTESRSGKFENEPRVLSADLEVSWVLKSTSMKATWAKNTVCSPNAHILFGLYEQRWALHSEKLEGDLSIAVSDITFDT